MPPAVDFYADTPTTEDAPSKDDSVTPDDDDHLVLEEMERRRVATFARFRVFTPGRVTVLLTAINMLTYLDRGIVSGAIGNIRASASVTGEGQQQLGAAASGALVSVFMIGFFATSPLFAAATGVLTSRVIMLLGLGAWTVSVAVAGLVQGYWPLFAARAAAGLGEAAVAGVAVTIIDNVAPLRSRTTWIGAYYGMVPIGTAAGVGLGGALSGQSFLGAEGWRVLFILEAVPMIFFMALLGRLPAAYNTIRFDRLTPEERADELRHEKAHERVSYGPDDSGPAKSEPTMADRFESPMDALMHLAGNRCYVFIVAGYTWFLFALGAVAVWGIAMLQQGPLHLSPLGAAAVIGGVSTTAGIGGSLFGGWAVDWLGGSRGLHGVYQCIRFSLVCGMIALPCGVGAIMAPSVSVLVPVLAVGLFFMSAITPPYNASLLTVVPRPLRTYSVTTSIFVLHMFGNTPSPIVAGLLSERFTEGCQRHLTEAACSADAALHHCFWVAAKHRGENSVCTNEHQLRNALAIVFSAIALSFPLWGAVLWWTRHAHGTADEPTTDDAEAPTVPGLSARPIDCQTDTITY